ncbi:hypothetical protein [Coralloluteibacterium thermophilus]|uniref:Lectin n=1 Tax=Coralloluteibacterium thermophilum TaxID=2707049 RepID=A0ABV9NII2_9GAMM
MPSPIRCCLILGLAAALTACGAPATSDAEPQSTPLPPGADAGPAPAPSASATPVPGAGASGTRSAVARLSDVVGFEGFGPAAFGDDEEALRMAWGREMREQPAAEGASCRYLFPYPAGDDGFRLAFMLEDGRFVRLDVDTPEIVAPGGGTVGMSVAEIAARYPDRLQRTPHKYVEGGEYLAVPADQGDARLVFATDADGRVTAWRLGIPPQVDYVEGCS